MLKVPNTSGLNLKKEKEKIDYKTKTRRLTISLISMKRLKLLRTSYLFRNRQQIGTRKINSK